jgi:hypothetical protein
MVWVGAVTESLRRHRYNPPQRHPAHDVCLGFRARHLVLRKFFALSPFDNSDFVISRLSWYIMYGSSNLILKNNEEPGAYGDSSACALPLVGGELTVVHTTKPPSASPFHLLLWPNFSVNALNSGIDGNSWNTMTINPYSRANPSTTAVD